MTASGTEIDVQPARTLWLLSIAHAVNHAQVVLLPLIFLRIIDEFHVTAGSVAILAAAGAFASGAVQLSYASLTRYISRKRLLAGGGILFGGGFAAQALAGSFTGFAIPNVLSRIGGSPQHPVGNGLLAEQFPTERRGFAISAHIAGGNVGTVVVAVLGAPTIALVGWRGASVVFGIPAIVIALGILLLGRKPLIVGVYLGGAVGFVAFLLAGSSLIGLWVGIATMGLFSFAESPQLQALLADIAPPSIRDASFAAYFTLAFGVGSLWTALYGAIIAVLGDQAGLPVVFWLMAISFFLAALSIVPIREPARRLR